jgi:hypothetical protein
MNETQDENGMNTAPTLAPGRYAAVVKQDGHGCDYTIGCGELTIPLAATTLEDARREVATVLHEDHSYPSRYLALEHVLIVTVAEVMSEEDVLALIDAPEPEDEATAARRREYERLKREFG